MDYKIYYFIVDCKEYAVIYKNRPFLRIKNYLKLKKEILLIYAKNLKVKLITKMSKIKKRLFNKVMLIKYGIDIEGLNIAGDIDFSRIGKVVIPEVVLGQLNLEFRKLEVSIEC